MGEATDGREAVTLAREHRPDVVPMDIRMPVLNGIEATRQLAAPALESPTRVLILTTFDLDEYVFDALRAGASGFLLKDVAASKLAAGVRMVAAGDARLAPTITRRLIEQFAASTPAEPPPGLDELTPRGLEILRSSRQANPTSKSPPSSSSANHSQDARRTHADKARTP